MQEFGNFLIDDDRELTGQILGKVRVVAGGHLLLPSGSQIVGTLTIEDGGEAEVHGEVCGVVTNRGSFTLFGRVVGCVRGKQATNPLSSGQVVGKRPS